MRRIRSTARCGRDARRQALRSFVGLSECHQLEDLPDRAPHHVGRVDAHALERPAVRAGADGAARVHRAAGDRRAAAGRSAMLRQRGRTHVALPALLPVMRRSPLALVRHLPLLLFLAGMPFFAIALADPHTGFAREEVSYPGRRIALLVDASTSMVIQFESTREAAGRGDVLHRGGRGRAVHPAPDERSVSRSRGAHPVRQLGLRRDAVHQRLREHPAEHPADQRSARVGTLHRLGHDDHRRASIRPRSCSRRSTS